jgi:hypothetical protein
MIDRAFICFFSLGLTAVLSMRKQWDERHPPAASFVPKWNVDQSLELRRGIHHELDFGIDLAKLFSRWNDDEHGRCARKEAACRDQMATFFIESPAMLIGMEACGFLALLGAQALAMGHGTPDSAAVQSNRM